ncbi:MAG: nuclear transport factor 2 family protein [Ktedonobacterales bacterium]
MTTDPEGDRPQDRGVESSPNDADLLRATERRRLQALVEADLDVADRLHAGDFQLITPSGVVLSKEQYLGKIASGEIDYQVWEPDTPIDVRLNGRVALMRYRSRLDIIDGGNHVGLRLYWHTDSYEQRDGRWQVVWSHATEIKKNDPPSGT